ncbi:tRNA lysidine(34) synthetase TilS [Mucilaginibacter jinjuensis]|uniref:tRNA(Ile)-lysidine synthase n=1 Tax=Mucilaginibacter jinjuensis TaxID=1176721 RepID=A0ABY7T7K0_9SPHI|nr:tRNA lysidine(34) synthetase TilS [Mucilaginibacter jinjuensis]WCT11826.1 tRNA lysidine(34) synthetase TilS [Mucilaginibacter jinjuensis]
MLPLALFNAFAQQNSLFARQTKIIAAVSGGMDSVLMARLLHAARHDFVIAHCNFQLRGDEALRDQAFCQQLAADLNVPFHTINFDTTTYATTHKISIQMAARDMRYTWFEELRLQLGFDVIALAHHQNDTIETILLNLTRGTGIAGLHGIRPKVGNLVRPLLFLSREEVIAIVKAEKIDYVEDSSNASVKYARNKIRHEVVPKLKELNPNLENTFQEHLQHFAELEELFEMQLEDLRSKLFVKHLQEIQIPISELQKLKPQQLLIFGLLKPFGFNVTSVNDLIDSLGKHAGRKFEATDWNLILDRDKVIISPAQTEQNLTATIDEQTDRSQFGNSQFTITHTIPPYEIVNNLNIAAVDAALLNYPLSIRTWQLGDYFYPLGMKTRKKLSDFFIGQKVPVHRKSQVPVLVNGNGDIIWVAGFRVDNRYKITPGTKKISIFELTEL